MFVLYRNLDGNYIYHRSYKRDIVSGLEVDPASYIDLINDLKYFCNETSDDFIIELVCDLIKGSRAYNDSVCIEYIKE